jgi:hypothetical protein
MLPLGKVMPFNGMAPNDSVESTWDQHRLPVVDSPAHLSVPDHVEQCPDHRLFDRRGSSGTDEDLDGQTGEPGAVEHDLVHRIGGYSADRTEGLSRRSAVAAAAQPPTG